ncbi:MAG: hemolysin family protein [Candidatus Nanopelagicales bacterium]|jgi:CBS domain containing-hemolysin-like protein
MTTDVWLIVIAILLVVTAWLLVMAETAIGRVSRGRAEDLARDGVRGGARLLDVVSDRPRYVNVLLFLSTVASVTAIALVSYVGVVGFQEDRGWPVWLSLLVVVAMMVVVNYVVLGVAARTLGRQHADRIALRSAGITSLLAGILGPLATLLIIVGNTLTPGRGYREGPFATQAELRELVDIAEAEDLIEDDERQMIHSVFELGDTFAREVMVPRTEMIYIERHKTLRQALSLGLRSGFSRIPVIGENSDDVVGIVYLKDVVRRVFDRRDAEQTETVESLMRPAFMVPDSKQVDELLKDMQAARTHMAIVVDEYGGTAGLVTIEDVLEEIVGEIADEYDTAAPEVARLEDGAVRVSARMHVDDFADLIDVDVESDDEGVDTVLGLMGKRLGRVPIPGATIDVDGWRLTAEQGMGRRNRIGSVLAVRIQEPQIADDEAEIGE